MSKRLPNLAPPFAKTRNKIAQYLSRPFQKVSAKQRFWIGFVLLTLITTVLIHNPFWHSVSEPYKTGEILRQSIISPADISVVNDEETGALRLAARESIRSVFTFESNRAEQAVQGFRSSWEGLQRKFDVANSTVKSNSNVKSNVNAKPSLLLKPVEDTDIGRLFSLRRYSPTELDSVARALRESADGSIYNDSDRQYFQNEITLIDRQKPNQQSIVSLPESSMTALSTARAKLNTRLTEIKVEAFYKSIEAFVQPSVIFDSAATESSRLAAEQSVQPVPITLKRGQMVAREGEAITPNMMAQILAIRNYTETSRQLSRFFGLLFLIGALFWLAWKFIELRGTVTRLILSPE